MMKAFIKEYGLIILATLSSAIAIGSIILICLGVSITNDLVEKVNILENQLDYVEFQRNECFYEWDQMNQHYYDYCVNDSVTYE